MGDAEADDRLDEVAVVVVVLVPTLVPTLALTAGVDRSSSCMHDPSTWPSRSSAWLMSSWNFSNESTRSSAGLTSPRRMLLKSALRCGEPSPALWNRSESNAPELRRLPMGMGEVAAASDAPILAARPNPLLAPPIGDEDP